MLVLAQVSRCVSQPRLQQQRERCPRQQPSPGRWRGSGRRWRWPWCDAVPGFYCPWPTCPGAALLMWAGGEGAGAGSAGGHSRGTPRGRAALAVGLRPHLVPAGARRHWDLHSPVSPGLPATLSISAGTEQFQAVFWGCCCVLPFLQLLGVTELLEDAAPVPMLWVLKCSLRWEFGSAGGFSGGQTSPGWERPQRLPLGSASHSLPVPALVSPPLERPVSLNPLQAPIASPTTLDIP